MECAKSDSRRRCLGLLGLLLGMAAATGCQTVKIPEEQIAASSIPRELEMRSMPEYRVAPPDLLIVEVLEAATGRPITGERLVRPDGTITLGFYGDVYVAGLTRDEIKEKVIIHLREILSDEQLGLIGRDGENNPIGIPPRDSDRVFVDVAAYNSQVYYVQGDVNLQGRFPITGNETVLDAINYAGNLSPFASVPNVRLVRPAPSATCKPQVLPINLAAIIQEGDQTTNYQIMPNDRIYVYRDPIVRASIFLDRLAQPFNTVVNTVLQYSFAARSVRSISQGLFGNNSGSSTGTTTGGFGTVPSNTPAF